MECAFQDEAPRTATAVRVFACLYLDSNDAEWSTGPLFLFGGNAMNRSKQSRQIRRLAICAMVAALYAVVTVLTASFSYAPVQLRLAEAMCVLPLFLPYTSWGLVVGCLLANLFSTVSALDIVIGTLATAIACIMTVRWRKIWVAVLAPVFCNAVLVGAMLAWVYMRENLTLGFAINAIQVGVGELAVMLVLGLPLCSFLRRTQLLDRWR